VVAVVLVTVVVELQVDLVVVVVERLPEQVLLDKEIQVAQVVQTLEQVAVVDLQQQEPLQMDQIIQDLVVQV